MTNPVPTPAEPDPRFQIDRRRRWMVRENYVAPDGWATAFRDPTDEEWATLAAAESQREALLTGPQLAAVREAVEYRLFGEDVPNRAVLSRAADRLAAAESQRDALDVEQIADQIHEVMSGGGRVDCGGSCLAAARKIVAALASPEEEKPRNRVTVVMPEGSKFTPGPDLTALNEEPTP